MNLLVSLSNPKFAESSHKDVANFEFGTLAENISDGKVYGKVHTKS